MTFLWRIISEDGYRMDPKATSAVTHSKNVKLKTKGEVRRVVGRLGVYRRHIKNFAQINCKTPLQSLEPWYTTKEE